MEAHQALSQLQGTFDLVFLDPPYAKEQIVADIEALAERELAGRRGHGRLWDRQGSGLAWGDCLSRNLERKNLRN